MDSIRRIGKSALVRTAVIVFWLLLISSNESLSAELEWRGFAQVNTSVRTTGEYPNPTSNEDDFISGESKFRLQLDGYSDDDRAGFSLKVDLAHDSINDKTDAEMREGYIDYFGETFDVRIGRQIITWGTGDLLFINDLFPKDWEALFTGSPMEYMKIGSDAIKTNIYGNALNVEFVIMPFFKEDNLPSPNNFFMYNPFSSLPTQTDLPDRKLSNTEFAVRISKSIAGFDSSLYAYRGFWPTPSGKPDDPSNPTGVTMKYPRLAVYGFSLQGNLATGVLNIEGGFYDSRDDRNGADPFVPNSQWRYLAGFQKQFGADTIVSIQYYGEALDNYDSYKNNAPAGLPLKEKNHRYVTLRFMQFFSYQTLKASVFVFYSPDEEDYYFIPEVRYTLIDGMWLAVGANIFGGADQTTFFGQFDKNDNIYSTFRYEF